MYEIHFYEPPRGAPTPYENDPLGHFQTYRDKNGRQLVLEYMRELGNRKDKDSRIKLNKIADYIEALSQYGTRLREPYIKHLEDDIWELRPLRNEA